jgi:cyclic di-GMP phosphodiesterase Gmr
MESSVQFRKAPVSLRRESDQLRTPTRHAEALRHALETLLRADSDPFAIVLGSLRNALPFDQAMVLAETSQGSVCCIAAVPRELVGTSWAAQSPAQVGAILSATPSIADLSERWTLPPDLIAPAQPTLCLPFGPHERRGFTVLSRTEGERVFDSEEIAIGREFALLAAVALAMYDANKMEQAQRSSELLQGIVDLLPVGLTVQKEDGRFILVNSAAAANSGLRADDLAGATPAEILLSAEQAANRRRREASALQTGKLVTAEEKVGLNGERTLLTTHQAVRILDETLLLSTSLDITDRKRIESELARRAYFDELTGLPKGALIHEHVEALLERTGKDGRFALAFIDLDNFKHINDYYSHAVGDALLVKVASRIAGRIRPSDMLARISGDEFVLLIDPLDNSDQLQTMVDQLLDALKQPFHIEGFEVFTSASIGVSIHPEHGRSYEALRRNADSAMSRAKSAGKGSAATFDRNMGQAITARMELEQRLRLAIRDRQFRCAFQPKVDIRSQEVVGFEALIRWCDDRGVIQAPSDLSDWRSS